MTPEDPRHGTRAGAMQHWKDGETACTPCKAAATRQSKANELLRLAGRPAMITLGPRALKVIVEMPRNQLAAATGMSHSYLRRLETAGVTKRVHRRTRDRILTAGAVPAWTPIGIQRRVQALAALGWSLKALGDHAGMNPSSLGCLRRRSDLKHVRRGFALQVIALYDELSMALPPAGPSATETVNEARRRGYAPPLAWEDIDYDLAPAGAGWRSRREQDDEIDESVVVRAMAGDFTVRATVAEKVEIARRWEAAGRSTYELEKASGWNISRYRDRQDGAA